MADEKQRQRYATWNGMDRPANVKGVPIMPFVGLLISGLLTVGLGVAIWSVWVGVVLLIPFLMVGFAFFAASSLDDRFMRRVVFSIRRLFLSTRFGKGLILTPQNPKWSQFYGKRYALCRHVSRGDDAINGTSRRT